MFGILKRIFMPSLRDLCEKEYGSEFLEDYDRLRDGMPVGDMGRTMETLEKIDKARAKYLDRSWPS